MIDFKRFLDNGSIHLGFSFTALLGIIFVFFTQRQNTLLIVMNTILLFCNSSFFFHVLIEAFRNLMKSRRHI